MRVLLYLLLAPLFVFAQSVYIPDNNFEQKLIDLGYDDLIDNYVLSSAVSNIEELDISDSSAIDELKIIDITGINDFSSLKTLIANNQNINVDFELNNLSELEYLSLKNNSISYIDVSSNVKLKYLDIGGNNFYGRDDYFNHWDCNASPGSWFYLDLSNNIFLETLIFNNIYTTDSDLTEGLISTHINIKGITSLKYVDISLPINSSTVPNSLFFNSPVYIDYNTGDNCSFQDYCTTDSSCSYAINTINLGLNQDLEYINTSGRSSYPYFSSENYNLKHIICGGSNYSGGPDGGISLLDKFQKLETLELKNTAAREIDILENTKLKTISLEGTAIEYLDLTNNPLLESVEIIGLGDFKNKFVALNLANGQNNRITNLNVQGNFSLDCIVIDENFSPPSSWQKEQTHTYSWQGDCFEQKANSSKLSIYSSQLLNLIKAYDIDSRLKFNNAMASGMGVTRRSGNRVNSIYNAGIASLNFTDLQNFNYVYYAFYRVINSANNIINSFSTYSDPQSDEEEMINQAVGLAKFFRAYSYFYLVRTYGDVPIQSSFDKYGDPCGNGYLGELANATDIEDLILSDAIEAATLLPEQGTTLRNIESTTLPEKHAAYMLLSKYWLNKASISNSVSEWQSAYDYAKVIYDSGRFGLVSNYWDLFNENNEDLSESIFEIKSGQIDNYSTNFSQFQRNFTPWKYRTGMNFGWLSVNVDIYELHNLKYPNDPRLDVTYLHQYTRADNGLTVTVYPSNQTRSLFGNSFPYHFKFSSKDKSSSSQFNLNQNFIVYRYSELLLMLAEISNELQNGEQLTYLSEVLNRVGLDPHSDYYNDQQSFREAIMREYKFELLFEGEDFFTNRRRGYQWFLEHTIIPHNTGQYKGQYLYTPLSNRDTVLNDNEEEIMKLTPPECAVLSYNNDIEDKFKVVLLYPNPTKSILIIEGNKEYDIWVYDILGNKLMALTGNSINMEHLPPAVYIVKVIDKSNNEELTYKVLKN